VTKGSNGDNIGETRTYAQLRAGQEFNYKNWIDAVRAGRTFVTSGPLLTISANGEVPGSVLDVTDEPPSVHVRADARSYVRFERLEVVANGATVASSECSGSTEASIEADVPIPDGGWLAARCIGDYDAHRADHVGAQTSPIYVTIRGQARHANAVIVAKLTQHLNRMLEWIGSNGRFENDEQRNRLAGIFLAAKEELTKRANS
jgi:hypothetical protein